VDRLIEAVIEAILGLHGPVVYIIVGLLAFFEAPFFIGLVTPGELAMAGGGVLASRGQAELGWVAVAAGVGTVLGNSAGYWIGRIWGTEILGWERVQRRLGTPINKTRSFFRERGEWAVVLGRFASFLRVFVPFVAGASQMPYRRFVLFDLPTGALWGLTWVVLGVVLGESWGLLRALAGPAAVLVLLLLVLALAIRWVARRIAARQDRIAAAADRVMETRGALWLRRHFGRQLRWVGRRFDPRVGRGLNLTLGFVILLVGMGAVGLVLSQTYAVRGLALIDFPVLEWMGRTRTPEAVAVARRLLEIFRPPGMLVPTVLLIVYVGIRIGSDAALRTAVGVLGSGFGALILDEFILEGIVPRAEFPSVPVAVVTALVVHATAGAGSRLSWARAVATAAVGVFGMSVVGLATLVAGVAAPSGIVFGAAGALTWSTLLEVQSRLAHAVESR
jgi:membrane protein DedA with SNARE-associated domain